MKLIFDWCDSFDEIKTSWREDEQLISIKIAQNECGFAIAKAVLFTKHPGLCAEKRFAKIGIQFADDSVAVLFSGRVISFPAGFGSSSVEIELISEPSNYLQQLCEFREKAMRDYALQNKHTEENYQFDDLFFSDEDLQNPTAFLEGNNKIFYWDMKNGQLSLSDIHHGKNMLEINGGEILQNSLKVRLAREPYKAVTITINAGWLQYESGFVDLMSMIAPRFAHGKINSFTDIRSSLERLCRFQERSGYSLLFKNIKEVIPDGLVGQYPQVSPEFSVGNKKVKFKRFYFAGQLVCGWQYKQKRTEQVCVRVVNGSAENGREKNLNFKLKQLQLPKQFPIWHAYTYYENCDKVIYSGKVYKCNENHASSHQFEKNKWTFLEDVPDALQDDSCCSFFATMRGKNAIKYAIKRAIALINYSQRYIEIDFCVNAEKYILDATIANSVKILDSRFQNGYITGKIIKTEFSADSSHRLLKITVGCQRKAISPNIFKQLSELSIPVSEDKAPILPSDIVRNVEIQNSPEEQLIMLAHSDANDARELKEVLKKHPTKIKLTLHPQNTVREIVTEIKLPNFEINEEKK
ncbi:MAG: hypothetical protein K6C34_00085 [Alphaproteobacteria bacterium]|nr:hypothetical protein [Alphaproteobacteria bacterium]